jgi:hypothetical protein
MLIFGILFAKLVFAEVTIRQAFDEYVTSQSESFAFTLSDYFIGPNLNFTVNSTSSAPWTYSLSDPFTLQLSSQASFTGTSGAFNLSQSRKLRSYTDSDNMLCILAYYSNNITSYRTQDLALQWSVLVNDTANNAFIQDIAVSRGAEFIYAVVTTGTNSSNYRTQVYIGSNFYEDVPTFVPVPGYALLPQQSVRIEVSDLFSVILNSTNNSVASEGSITVYNISDPTDPSSIGQANASSWGVDLSFYDPETLMVADHKAGLLKYYITNSSVYLLSQLNQTGFTSIDISGAFGVAALDNLVVLVDLDALVADELVSVFSSDGAAAATAVSGKLVGGMSFVSTYTTSPSLAVVDFDLLPSQGLVKNWDTVQTDQFAPFDVFLNPDGSYSYVRLDASTVSLWSLVVGEWTFSGYSNPQNFTADVTAFIGANTADNATLTFTGLSVSPDSLILYANNSKFVGSADLALETASVYIDLTPSLYASQFFGGAYQSYQVSVDKTAEFSVGVSLPSKQSSSVVQTTNYTSLSADVDIYIVSDGSQVSVFNYAGSLNYSYPYSSVFPHATVTATLWCNNAAVAYSSAGPNLVAIFDSSRASSIVLGQTCDQFKSYHKFVYCGNSTSIAVFRVAPGFIIQVAVLNAEVLGLTDLNFTDFTFGTGEAGTEARDYLILVDVAGLRTVALDDLSVFDPTFEASAPFASSINVTQAITSTDIFAVTFNDGAVAIYSVNYATAPTLVRRLAGKGSLVSAACTEGVLALQYSNFTDILDLYADALNAFYTTYPSTPCQVAAGSGLYVTIYSLCQLSSPLKTVQTARLSSQQIYGQRAYSTLNYPIILNITTTSPFIDTVATVVTGNITASNSFGSASVPFSVQVTNQSPYAVSNLHLTSFAVASENDYEVALLPYFIGQDLEFSLNINGHYEYYDPLGLMGSAPAVVSPKTVLSRASAALNVTAIDVCLNCKVTTVLSNSSVSLLDTLAQTVYETAYPRNSSECNSVSTLSLGNDAYQVFINCFSTEAGPKRVSVAIQGQAEAVIETRSVPSVYSFVKTVPLTSSSGLIYSVTPNQEGAVFAETRYLLSYFNYSGNSSTETDLGEFYFEDFNLTALSVSALDSYYIADNQVLVYMADAAWGVRVFNVALQDGLPQQSLFNSIETNSTNPVSIGVCADWLFLGGYDEQVYQYSLASDPTVPVFVQSFYTTGNFTGVSGNIDCNSVFDPAYVVVPMTSKSGNFTARVLSLQAESTSAIYADLPFNDTAGAAYFINSSTVRGLGGEVVGDFELFVPTLYMQRLNKSQYADMLDEYGSNHFQIFITASNDNVQVNSTSFTVTRTVANNDDDDDDFGCVLAPLIAGLLVA